MKEHWRSAEELLARSHRDRDAVPTKNEFPVGAESWDASLSRRGFLSLLGAMIAASTAAGCRRAPSERIVPYARPPRDVTPGVASHYASSFVLDGYATGVVVESHEGRPTKIEGNPEHPASLGATDAITQAAVLGLYDPDRARSVLHRGAPATYDRFLDAFVIPPDARVHVLLEPTTSPTRIDLLARIRQRHRSVQIHFDAPFNDLARWEGARIAFGRPVDSHLDLRNARVIVTLDDDLFTHGPMRLRYARDFAAGRRLRTAADPMNRLYALETAPTCTGFAADHRLRVRPSESRSLAATLLAAVRSGHAPAGSLDPERHAWITAVARDLVANAGASVVTAGATQSPEVHALVHAINAALGNAGHTVRYTEPIVFEAGTTSHGLAPLARALHAGEVDVLLVLEGNPAYTAAADLDFARAVRSAPRSAYVGLYGNETAAQCEWFVPATHWLESWGDARAGDGTVSIVQPLIAPLFEGRQSDEVLAALMLDARTANAHTMVRDHWRTAAGSIEDFDGWWDETLQRGFVSNSAALVVTPELQPAAIDALAAAPAVTNSPLELAFTRDARVHDGRFTNNAWLLELPDPVTKLTWENAAQLSPTTAERYSLTTEDVIEVLHRGRRVDAPVVIVPGHADGVVSLTLGYGRAGDESLARGRGVNANALRFSDTPFVASDVRITKRPGTAALAITQEHWSMEGRDPVRIRALESYRREPRFANDTPRRQELLYRLPPGGSHQWGMSIDLALCNGCSACVVACQAENNVPVVGQEGVRKSREMHWLRVDRYFVGNLHDPSAAMQPMMCQHCESAPCEYVCPVNATVHSPDGLNEQVYNRCVGTRFCSNNCPYKVRRFNYLDYHRDRSETERMARNPQVTVRDRGVMEKCTYCVQRLRRAEITARVSGRALRDIPVDTACAQACPTGAIVFGLVSDPESEVSRARRNERSYAVLEEFGTVPRTRYLARIHNPNPAIETGAGRRS